MDWRLGGRRYCWLENVLRTFIGLQWTPHTAFTLQNFGVSQQMKRPHLNMFIHPKFNPLAYCNYRSCWLFKCFQSAFHFQ